MRRVDSCAGAMSGNGRCSQLIDATLYLRRKYRVSCDGSKISSRFNICAEDGVVRSLAARQVEANLKMPSVSAGQSLYIRNSKSSGKPNHVRAFENSVNTRNSSKTSEFSATVPNIRASPNWAGPGATTAIRPYFIVETSEVEAARLRAPSNPKSSSASVKSATTFIPGRNSGSLEAF